MTYSEYEKMLSGVVENPDTGSAVIADVLKNLKTDFTNVSSMTAQANADAQKIRDLQDANIKLFMQITGARKDEAETPPEELTGDAVVDAFFKNLMQKEDN